MSKLLDQIAAATQRAKEAKANVPAAPATPIATTTRLTTAGTGRVLHITDKIGVTSGYDPAFKRVVERGGIPRSRVVNGSIYDIVDEPLMRKGNEKLWRFNPEKLGQIKAAFDQRINSVKPSLIVVSDPAVMGVLVNGDVRLGTLDKCRGGVYEYAGIPTVVTYPITAINRIFDESALKMIGSDETPDQQYEPYKVPKGDWILHRDWEKAGRIYNGKPRVAPPFVYSVCRNLADCVAARDWLTDCVLIAVDIETGHYPALITCKGFAGLHKSGRIRSFVFPYWDKSQPDGTFWDVDDQEMAWIISQEILNNPVQKTMQNGNYDSSYFIKYRLGTVNWFWDSMLLWYSLYMELDKSLDFISSILLDNFQYWKDDIKGKENETDSFNMETYWRYNALDCYNTLLNTVTLLRVYQTNPTMRSNYSDTYMRAMSGLQMSMRGFKADFARRSEHEKELTQERDTNAARLRYLINSPDFNFNSPDQKSQLLYDILGAPERTARGRYVDQTKVKKGTNGRSSGAIALKLIKTEHPFFRIIIDALTDTMEPDKQISNVCNMKLFTDRFRTSFNAAGTETTRYGSRGSSFWDGGNAQNIRKKYRDWMVPEPNQVIFEMDYSQSDDVFVGYESEDVDKIAVIESGRDGHAVHGELFFGKPYDEIVAGKKANDPLIVHPTLGIRQLAKRVVHGTNFQMAAMTLYTTMGRESVVAAAQLLRHQDAERWSQEKLVLLCGSLMSKYRKKYKRLNRREWYADILAMLKHNGLVTNAFGVTRRFLGDPDDNGTQREATAFVGQSDTAGNMNRTMYEIDHGYIPEQFRDGPNPDSRERPLKMSYEDDGFRFILQVHDSFVCQLDTTNPNWKRSAHNLLTVMERPIIIKGRQFRVKTESELSMRWGSKAAIEWKSRDPYDLDRIYTEVKTGVK